MFNVQTQAGGMASLPFYAPPLQDWAGSSAANFQPALMQNFLQPPANLRTTANPQLVHFFKPQSQHLNAADRDVVGGVLNRLNLKLLNDDYDLARIPDEYYDPSRQTNPLDVQVATELGPLGSIRRNGVTMSRSNGIQSIVQENEVEGSSINDGISKEELKTIVRRQEVFHENLQAYNALQADPQKRIPGDLNEILGEEVTNKTNKRYSAYYATIEAMNSDLARKVAEEQKINPALAVAVSNVNTLPENYGGIEAVARNAAAKTLQQLGLTDGTAKPSDQQFLDALEKSRANDLKINSNLKPYQQYQSFWNKLALDARKSPAEVEQILVANYSANLDEVVRNAARTA